MTFFTNLTHRGFLKTAAASAILLTLVGSLIADDKSPKQDPRRQTSGHEQWIGSVLRRRRALRWAKQCQRIDHSPVRQPRAYDGAS